MSKTENNNSHVPELKQQESSHLEHAIKDSHYKIDVSEQNRNVICF